MGVGALGCACDRPVRAVGHRGTACKGRWGSAQSGAGEPGPDRAGAGDGGLATSGRREQAKGSGTLRSAGARGAEGAERSWRGDVKRS